MFTAKTWYKSKTLWANFIAIVAMGLQAYAGHEVLNLEAQGAILAALNIALRLVTNTPVVLSADNKGHARPLLMGLLAALMLAGFLMISGCASPQKANTAITSLRTAHVSARSAAIAVKSLCIEGKLINAGDCALAEQSWEAYRQAEDTAKFVIRGSILAGKDPDNDPDVARAIESFTNAALDIVSLAMRVQAITAEQAPTKDEVKAQSAAIASQGGGVK